MRAFAFCLLALVVAASGRELQQLTALNCQADSMATLDLSGSGSGSATATSFCQAQADAEREIRNVVEEYVEPFEGTASNGQCTEAMATRSVDAVAKAIASVYVKVTTEVEIEGTGTACANAFAAGDSLAVSIVQIYLDISVEIIMKKYPTEMYGENVKKVVDEKVDQASGQSTGSAVAAVIASAWAAASDEACTTGGFKSNFETAFVNSTAVAAAELWATVVVELCSNFDDASKDELKEWAEKTSSSFSTISGMVSADGTSETTTTDGGVGSGTATEIEVCGGLKATCCTANTLSSNTCSCGTGCSMTKDTTQTVGQGVWKDDSDQSLCFCA